MKLKRPSSERTHLLSPVVWAVLAVMGVLAGCGDDRPVVDLGSDGTRDMSPLAARIDPRPTLHVAVGAMISPEITRQCYQDLLTLIAARIGRRAVFAQRRTYAEVNELVRTHEADIAFVCSGPYTSGHEDFGMELLAVPVAHGLKVYHSYMLARRDSVVQTLDDLRGKRFAFTDPDSNTGCLVPTYMLAQRGETPESFFGETFFTGSHDNSIKAVAEGLADGAAVDSLIWEFMNANSPSETSRTRIVAKSPPYGIPPIVVDPDLDGDTKQHLKTVLLAIHEDPDAIPLLRRLQIDRFVEGEDSMYDTVREMRRWLDDLRKGRSP